MAKTETAIVTEMRCGTLIPVQSGSTRLVLQGTFAVVDANSLRVYNPPALPVGV